ncbi:MAG TPA: shikimate dehydrogenase [Candidatus Acidoferrales bacterium]|nr:shikimate dehydrogenase [Candidatus Acidoferrales bacterium]
MTIEKELAALQSCIVNKLEPKAIGDRRLAGVIGDAPSHYSKSPALWNAAFRSLDMKATYLALDVEAGRLGELAAVLKDSEHMLGVNVTVPHKQKIMDYLDALDDGAARIQAVNTVVREPDSRLVGFNTDGEGFIKSVLEPQPGETQSLIDSFKDIGVLLLGAGGSARAVAFHVADLLNKGRLLICNRTFEHAAALAGEIQKAGHHASAIKEDELSHWAPQARLIINCTTKGQGGVRKLDQGKTMSLEFYSALAPAHPVAVPSSQAADFREESKASETDIKNNNATSIELATSIPRHVCFYDLVYFPEQTVFLRHARQTGHVAMNGKGMIINQAVIAFCGKICRAELQSRGIDKPETARQVLEVMYGAW